MTTIDTNPRRAAALADAGALAMAGLALTVSAIHVEDQGGLTVLDDPTWLGWAYRLLELGGVATALLLLTGLRPSLARLAALLVGLGPLVGFVLSRTTGLPGSTDDIGQWGEPLGVVSLFVEVSLIAVAAAGLLAPARATSSRTPVTGARRTGGVPAAGAR